MNYVLHLGVYYGIFAILALSLNLVVGYGGILTLAHAAFFSLGAYVCAVLMIASGWPWWAALAGACVAGVLVSPALSILSLRLRGDFFVVASLAVQSAIQAALQNWYSPHERLGTWKNLTNGPLGITGIPSVDTFGIIGDTRTANFLLALTLTAATLLILNALMRSPWGAVLEAIRDDELAARGLGKRISLVKIQAFAVSCGFAAVAGAVYAMYMSAIDPSLGSLDQSISLLAMVLVGGVANLSGPMVGAGMLLLIPEVLRLQHLPEHAVGQVRLLVFGLLLVVMMHIRPRGMAGRPVF